MLTVQLDTPLPDALAVGAGTCLFVAGWCVADEGPIDALSVLVDGEERPVAAFGMPRLDVLRALGTPQSYRCGFWAWVDLHHHPPPSASAPPTATPSSKSSEHLRTQGTVPSVAVFRTLW